MLTAAQWKVVLPVLWKMRDHRKKKNGHPFVHSDRAILEGVLWILQTGARWKDLPRQFPPYTTVYQRFQTWVAAGIFRKILQALARDLRRRGGLNLSECYIDATFFPAKKGDSLWVQPKKGRVRNSWQLQTATLLQWPSTQALLHPTSPHSLKKRSATPS